MMALHSTNTHTPVTSRNHRRMDNPTAIYHAEWLNCWLPGWLLSQCCVISYAPTWPQHKQTHLPKQ